MAVLSKKQMSEEDIKLNFITPAIQPNWQGHITMETKITDGRINIKGNIVARSKPKFADYIQQGCVLHTLSLDLTPGCKNEPPKMAQWFQMHPPKSE